MIYKNKFSFFKKIFAPISISRIEKNDLGEDCNIVYLKRFTLFKCRWFQIHLNHLLKQFPETHLFDQPWDSKNLILKGSFIEETPVRWTDNGFAIIQWRHRMATKRKKIGFLSIRKIKAETLRKICNESFKPLWELVITGPKKREWGFMEERNWINHEDYYKKHNFSIKKLHE